MLQFIFDDREKPVKVSLDDWTKEALNRMRGIELIDHLEMMVSPSRRSHLKNIYFNKCLIYINDEKIEEINIDEKDIPY